MRDIGAWLSSSYKKGKLLSGIIYLHRITDVRMDGTSIQYVRMFQRLCGQDALKNVLLTTTQWSGFNQEQEERREKELQDGDFWGELITAGASVARFMGDERSGLGLIDKLMGNEPKPICVQKELVDRGIEMPQTSAGKFMEAELTRVLERYQKDLEDLKRDLRKAITEKDDLFKEVLATERANSQRKLQKARDEKQRLADLHKDKMAKFEQAERDKEEERERNRKAVIAVAYDDISIIAHIHCVFKSYETVGRLIYDTDNDREFVKEPFVVKIRYRNHFFSLLTFPAKMAAQLGGSGMSSRNYINYNQGYYQCIPDSSLQRGSHRFIIFQKC